MTPLVTAIEMALDGLYVRWVKVVEALPEDMLNFHPLPADTNSVAQLVRHTTAVQDMFLLRVVGENPPYDHAHSLRDDPATRAELLGLLHDSHTRMKELLARADATDLGGTFTRPNGETVPLAWFVVHMADHGGEHLGHAELTAQLWRAQNT